MPIRDWPPSKLRHLWRRVLLVEAALVALPILTALIFWPRPAGTPQPTRPLDTLNLTRPAPPGALTLRNPSGQAPDSLRVVATPLGETTSTYFASDSVAFSLTRKNDTLRGVALTPAAARAAGKLLAPLDAALARSAMTFSGISSSSPPRPGSHCRSGWASFTSSGASPGRTRPDV